MKKKTDPVETRQSGECGRAYAHALATAAGLMWRDLTGVDIGIDGVVELMPKHDVEGDPIGFVFVQLKCRKLPIPSESFSIEDLGEKHHYWLKQRCPTLICFIKRVDYVGVEALWIDYGRVEKYRNENVVKIRDLFALTDPPVLITKSSRKQSSKAFYDWIERAIVSRAERQFDQHLVDAGVDMDAGNPQASIRRLKQVEYSITGSVKHAKIRADFTEAKALRRMANVREALEILQGIEKRCPSEHRSQLHYEIGFCHFLEALRTNKAKSWQLAEDWFLDSALGLTGRSEKAVLGRLAASSMVVWMETLRAFAENRLAVHRTAITDRLESDRDSWEKLKLLEPTFSRHSLNATRNLWCVQLSKGSSGLRRAEEERLRAVDLLSKPGGHCSRHTAVFMQLTTAWHAQVSGDKSAAKWLYANACEIAGPLINEQELRSYVSGLKKHI